MQRPEWAPPDLDLDVPSPARMYDALLGGSHNFGPDRAAAAMAVEMVPDLPRVAVSNRAFLRRAVRYLRQAGIDQFLDLGAGIPTVGNTHEIAQEDDPACRVCYVDNDPVAVAHATAILADNPAAIAVQADLRTPEQLLDESRIRTFVDFERPVGVLLVAVLHLLTDDDRPGDVLAALRTAVAPGSYVVISHLTSAQRPTDAARLQQLSSQRSGVPITFRTREQISGFFEGLTVVEPGVVPLPAWRRETTDDPDDPDDPSRSLALGGVGRRD